MSWRRLKEMSRCVVGGSLKQRDGVWLFTTSLSFAHCVCVFNTTAVLLKPEKTLWTDSVFVLVKRDGINISLQHLFIAFHALKRERWCFWPVLKGSELALLPPGWLWLCDVTS